MTKKFQWNIRKEYLLQCLPSSEAFTVKGLEIKRRGGQSSVLFRCCHHFSFFNEVGNFVNKIFHYFLALESTNTKYSSLLLLAIKPQKYSCRKTESRFIIRIWNCAAQLTMALETNTDAIILEVLCSY